MSRKLDDLQRDMEAAAARQDFAEAARLRDRISLLRAAGKTQDDLDFDPAGLARQQPGHMGLGTSQQRMTPPEGWTPPDKPDPMTRGRSRGKRRRA
jgi:hypothetical protein